MAAARTLDSIRNTSFRLGLGSFSSSGVSGIHMSSGCASFLFRVCGGVSCAELTDMVGTCM